jgi:hypothetical protein
MRLSYFQTKEWTGLKTATALCRDKPNYAVSLKAISERFILELDDAGISSWK